MKKFLSLTAFVFILNAASYAQVVPNHGFEHLNPDGTLTNWGNIYLVPITIDSSGNQTFNTIVYDGQFYAHSTDAHSGTGALELRNAWDFTANAGIAGAASSDEDSVFSSWGLLNLVPTYGTPFAPFEPFNFGFYCKYLPLNGDSAVAHLALWDSVGNQIGEGIAIIPSALNTYTLVTAPIYYSSPGNVDFYSLSFSTFITSAPGVRQPTFGTRMLVDDIGFNFVATSGIDELNNGDRINVYPNPATDYVIMYAGNTEDVPYFIRTFTGQLVSEGVLIPGENTIRTGNFSSGVYSVDVMKKNAILHGRIVRQ
jgi:hypothetical protein